MYFFVLIHRIFLNSLSYKSILFKYTLRCNIRCIYKPLKHGVLGFSTAGVVVRREWMEVNANYFASELLMPKPLLQRYGYMTAEEISAKCEVSKPAASIRAEQLGWS